MTREARKAKKRAEAIERQEAHDRLTLPQKLKKALERGHSGTREVKRLEDAVLREARKAKR